MLTLDLQSAAMALPGIAGMRTQDSQDMKAAAGGNRRAFQNLVRRHEERLLAFAYRFLGERRAAEDVVQEVFLTLWKERRRYRDEGKFTVYLYRIARLRCLAASKRRRSRQKLKSRALEVQAASSALEGADPAELRLVFRALEGLFPKERELVVLRHFEELSLEEIGEITGLRPGTIKSRLSRAMAKLRKEVCQ